MPIHVPTNETTSSILHQDILNRNVREYEKSPRCVHLCSIYVRVLTFAQS